MKESSKALTRAFGGFSIGVLISRISGMLRDVALAYFFGTSAQIAFFMVAYRFSNLLRRMLAETPLSSSFIPAFEENNLISERQGILFFRDLLAFLIFFLFLLLVVLMGGFHFFSLSFIKSLEGIEIASLTQIMFPSLFFITLYGLCSAFLQCQRSFFLPAMAPIAFNGVWIAACFFIVYFKQLPPMKTLAFGVVVAFAMQWLVIMPKVMKIVLKRISLKEWLTPSVFNQSLKTLIKPFILAAIGVSTTQINATLDSVFAKIADPSGPAYLWYAIRLEQVPVALFGVAISISLFPLLTKVLKKGEYEEAEALLKQSYDQMCGWMSFSMFGLVALGGVGLNLIFGRGQFDYQSIYHTTICLLAYSVGLLPHGLSLLFTSHFYAHQDFKTPMKSSLYAILIHVCSNVALVFFLGMGAASIALSTSLSSCFQMIYLQRTLKKHNQLQLNKGWKVYKFLATGLVAALSSLSVNYYLLSKAIVSKTLLSFNGSIQAAIQGGIVYLFTYFLMEKLFKEPEVFGLLKKKWLK